MNILAEALTARWMLHYSGGCGLLRRYRYRRDGRAPAPEAWAIGMAPEIRSPTPGGFDPNGRHATLLASTDWAPFFQTAIGALIGAGGAIGGGAFGSWFTWQKERQSVAAAFAAEVPGVIELFESRLELIRLGYKFSTDNPQIAIFETNLGKIGLLPTDIAAKFVGFYNQVAGIFLDLRTLNRGEIPELEGTANSFRGRLVENIETMLRKGKALVPELKEEATRSWKDCLQPA